MKFELKNPPQEAIILAGGMGTRLQSVVRDVPKPMAMVGGKPFLEYVIHMLEMHGIRKAVLSVGHLWEVIFEHFGYNWRGVEMDYAIETEPLGTGGGIKLAFEKTKSQDVFVLNGDTMFLVSLFDHWRWHQDNSKGALISLGLAEMTNFDRYGTVELDDEGRVKAFHEKRPMALGQINAGLYIVNRDLWKYVDVPTKFSFEKDILERYVGELRFSGCVHEGYFVDIGIPEDFARAQTEIRQFYWPGEPGW